MSEYPEMMYATIVMEGQELIYDLMPTPDPYKNEVVVTPAGIKSGWKWHAPSKVIVITLDPEKLNDFTLNEVGVVLSSKQLGDVPQFEDEDLTRAAEFLLEALEGKTLGFQVVFESLARVFLVKLIQKYGETASDHSDFSPSFTATHYKKVLDFVKSHFASPIHVEDMAKEVGLSPHHFSRLFKTTIGKSPMQFVMVYRLEQAQKMLANNQLTLVDIAHRCGFADQAHFSRSFKARYGKSPKLFRK